MMNTVKAFFVMVGLVASSAWAVGPSLPMGGTYSEKDTNIISIGGKTFVTNEETQRFDCEGKPTGKIPGGSDVQYTIVEPVKGPIPTLKTITRICS